MIEAEPSTMTNNSPPKEEIIPSEPGIAIHNFSEKLLDSVVHFHVMRMADSLYIWIGTDMKLVNLALAMQTKYSPMPCGSSVLSDSTDSPSVPLAQKFAKRTKKQVFMSYNALSNIMLIPLVEQRLVEEMKAHPEYF